MHWYGVCGSGVELTLGGVTRELTRKFVRLQNESSAQSMHERQCGHGQALRTRSVLSSCSTRALCESALGMAIML